ncbi:MAG: hypothetical protein Q9227_007416 [Pyrenula ochraceoflavens]
MPYDSRNQHGAPENPPFEKTKPLCTITTARNQHVAVDIGAKISKGFFQVDQKWTCYRRNYFSVTCSFSLHPPDITAIEQILYYQQANQTPEPIQHFFVAISAKTAVMGGEHQSEDRALVQHTPKRDKASESTPRPMMVRPQQPSTPSLGSVSNRGYGAGLTGYPNTMNMDYAPYGTPHQGAPTHHTFERIQFVKATANNGKRRAQQQFYHVVVDLLAEIGRNGEKVKIATTQSSPMVVRGRSPGHYKDGERRGSTANGGDSDRGPGSGHETTGGSGHMPPMMSQRGNASSMDWEPQGRGSQIGNRHYQAYNEGGYSSGSGESENSSPASTTFGMGGQGHQKFSHQSHSQGLALDQDSGSHPAFISGSGGEGRPEQSIAGGFQLPPPFPGMGRNWTSQLPPIPNTWSARPDLKHVSREDALADGSVNHFYTNHAHLSSTLHSDSRHGENDSLNLTQSREISMSEPFAAAS